MRRAIGAAIAALLLLTGCHGKPHPRDEGIIGDGNGERKEREHRPATDCGEFELPGGQKVKIKECGNGA